jgi:predicted DNA-binding transcriptional regulator AlpA
MSNIVPTLAKTPVEVQHPGRKDQLLAGERLIDRAEFQTLLGIAQSTFERWKAAGRVPKHIRFSRTCHRWRWREVQQWIAEGCPQPGRRG